MILRSLLLYIFILLSISKKVYLCNTSPNIRPQLSLAPLTRSISRMNSAIMRGAAILKGEDYDEFGPIEDDPIPEEEDNEYTESDDIPENEVEVTTIVTVTENSINYTILKDELEMINKTKTLINLFEDNARKLYENAEKNIELNKNILKNDSSEYDLESLNKNETTTEKSFYKEKNFRNMTEKEWENKRKRQRLEEEQLIEYRTKQFANERMMSDGIKINNNDKIDHEESSGIEDMELISTTTSKSTTMSSTKKLKKTKVSKKNNLQPRCKEGYVIAITNKPYSELLVPLHRAEMSNELHNLESYVKRRLIQWGEYTSYPLNYNGFFSQKYVMNNPKDCKGLEKFTKKAVSYGMFMEAGIFQCKCGTLKTISKVH